MTHTRNNDAILHVTTAAADLERAIDAAETLTADDPELRVHIIINGQALDAVTDPNTIIHPNPAVTVSACHIGLNRRGIDAQQMQNGIGTVPSAIIAIVSAQRDGAAYVRL